MVLLAVVAPDQDEVVNVPVLVLVERVQPDDQGVGHRRVVVLRHVDEVAVVRRRRRLAQQADVRLLVALLRLRLLVLHLRGRLRQLLRHDLGHVAELDVQRLLLAALLADDLQLVGGPGAGVVEQLQQGVAALEVLPRLGHAAAALAELHDAVAGLQPRLGRRALRVDETHLDAGLAVVAHGQDAEERLAERRQRAGQRHLVERHLLLAAQQLDGDGVALVAVADLVLQLGLAGHRLAVHGDDLVADLEAGRLGRRALGHAGDHRLGAELVAALERQAHEQALLEVLALLEPVEDGVDVLQRDGEADAGVVPLDAGGLPLGPRRGGHEPAVVDRRHLGVGLDGLAPDAVQRADDADADRRRLLDVAGQAAPDGDGRLADLDLALGHGRRHHQVLGAFQLQERQHARLVGGDDLGGVLLLAAGHDHGDGGRLVGEVEGAGDDVAVGADHQAAGRADALADARPLGPGVDDLGAAGRVDLHDRRGHAGHGGLDGLLFHVVQVLRPRRRRQGYGHDTGEQERDIRSPRHERFLTRWMRAG